MSGGAGNDVLVWNNGDGSDVMDGDGGNDEIEVNGSANAGDQFVIAPGSGGRTRSTGSTSSRSRSTRSPSA